MSASGFCTAFKIFLVCDGSHFISCKLSDFIQPQAIEVFLNFELGKGTLYLGHSQDSLLCNSRLLHLLLTLSKWIWIFTKAEQVVLPSFQGFNSSNSLYYFPSSCKTQNTHKEIPFHLKYTNKSWQSFDQFSVLSDLLSNRKNFLNMCLDQDAVLFTYYNLISSASCICFEPLFKAWGHLKMQWAKYLNTV